MTRASGSLVEALLSAFSASSFGCVFFRRFFSSCKAASFLRATSARAAQPQRQQDLRVWRWAARYIVARPDRHIELRQIQAVHKRPNHARQVIRFNLALQIDLVPIQLLAIRP